MPPRRSTRAQAVVPTKITELTRNLTGTGTVFKTLIYNKEFKSINSHNYFFEQREKSTQKSRAVAATAATSAA